MKRASRIITLLFMPAMAAGCAGSIAVQREAEVFNSIVYDDTACAALRSQRDALAARHGLATDVVREPMRESNVPGFGIFIPDWRGAQEKARARATGEITAMNRSLERRSCGSRS